jgi:hypothetical protein
MLPLPSFSRNFHAVGVVSGEIWRDHRKEGDSTYSRLLRTGSIVLERKLIPGRIAAHDPQICVNRVNDVRIAIAVRWPTRDHSTIYFNGAGPWNGIGRLRAVPLSNSFCTRQGGKRRFSSAEGSPYLLFIRPQPSACSSPFFARLILVETGET